MGSSFVKRYRRDPSPPTGRSVARDVAVRGLLPAVGGLLPIAYVVGEFLLPYGSVLNEARVNHALQDMRSPVNDLVLSSISHASGVVGAPATALAAFLVLRRRTGQWWFALVPTIAVALEALVYQSATILVGRRRPEGVEQRDWGLPDSSFPSGHVGAAACLVLVFALIAWSGDGPKARRVAWVVSLGGAAWVVVVAVSRLYLGMHHVTDAVAGVAIGAASALLGWGSIRRERVPERP